MECRGFDSMEGTERNVMLTRGWHSLLGWTRCGMHAGMRRMEASGRIMSRHLPSMHSWNLANSDGCCGLV